MEQFVIHTGESFSRVLVNQPSVDWHIIQEEGSRVCVHILNMYMLEKPIHKDLEVVQHESIARTSILRDSKAAHKITYEFVPRTLVVMLAVHDTYRVGHRSAVHSSGVLTTLRAIKEVLGIGK